ncbi:MAG TPA: TlpA disulfide reductase family protein [Vicinamibacterales bacterium]|jgi:thiol-disulfide isomerase/thioredoxin|nr:TlpA disulfide reductase family protein [Vicinamibacterales bacterium]
MRPRWIVTAAAVLAVALLTIPALRRSGTERIGPAAAAAPTSARSETCDASAPAKLDFVLKDMHNAPLKLADFKGKVIVLNFWATWCGPCKEEIPAFVELYDRYRNKGLVIVAVSIDDAPPQLQQFTREWKMQYPVAQLQSDIEDAYGPFYGVPTSYLIGRDGTICTKHLGPVSKDAFEQEIRALLDPKALL